jgi:two-component system NtrC family sensor kinase
VAHERVLIVDDSIEIQQLLTELVLEPNGYRAIVAADGQEGLRLALQERPDLVILDMQMPRMDGMDVLEVLRQQQTDIPVIVMTIRDSAEVAVRAFRLGARDYIIKPFAPHDMQEAIRRVLTSDRSRAEREQLTQQLMEANQQLQRQLQELNTIYTIGRSVTSLLDLDGVLNRVVEASVYVARAEEGLLMLLDAESNELYLRAAKDVDEKVASGLRVHVEDSVAGRAIQTGRPVLLAGKAIKIATGYLVKSLLYLPLRVPERGAIGVMGVFNRTSDRAFSERDVFLLSAVADYAAIAIENARLFETAEFERAKLEAILREAQEAVIVVDEQDNVLLCNAAARGVLGLVESNLTHRPVDAILWHSTMREMFLHADDEGQVVRSEVSLEDGRTFNAQLTPIEEVGKVLVMQDITHLKELDRIKSEFVATVSHDLRTPLTTIQGYIELLPRAGPLNEQQQDFINRAHNSMQAITELIGDLLDIGRIEAGFDLEMEPCNLIQVIEEAIRTIEPQASARLQGLHWKSPGTLPLVRGNIRTLRQVMDNLLSNAVKYTQEGGQIEVGASHDEGHIVVHVADTGIGIPPEQQPYIFDKFYRVESAEMAGITGSGLGLAIVKAVIEKHNGRVWVESKPGVGSTFSFVLPVVKT